MSSLISMPDYDKDLITSPMAIFYDHASRGEIQIQKKSITYLFPKSLRICRARSYNKALEVYDTEVNRLKDFKVLSEIEMTEKYGKNYLNDIGVCIYPCDKLKYPIKVSYDSEVSYEDAEVLSI